MQHIAYLVNQYPKVSHSFIRREIAALETLGLRVSRYTIRRANERLEDLADQAERERTRCVLEEVGWRTLAGSVGGMLLRRPWRAARVLGCALLAGWRSDRGMWRWLAYAAEAAVLVRWWEAAGVSHVHAHFATNPAAVAMLGRMLGGPSYSFTAHGPDDFDRAPWLSLDQKIARAAFVVVVSDYGRSELHRWSAPGDLAKIRVLSVGLDADFLGQPGTLVPDNRRIVCVGRLDREKGHLLLVEAVDLLRRRGVRCEVVLVGEGPLRGELEAAIGRSTAKDSWTLLGAASGSGVREQMLAARVVVLPSLAENLPVVLMEAMALQRPVIATAIAGIPELVTEGECGWLIPAGSEEALANAIGAALECPLDELQRMGEEGARRVAARHDARQSAAQLAQWFAAAVNAGGGAA